MIGAITLLQVDQNQEHTCPLLQWFERLSDHGAKHLGSVRSFHRVTGNGRSNQEVADLEPVNTGTQPGVPAPSMSSIRVDWAKADAATNKHRVRIAPGLIFITSLLQFAGSCKSPYLIVRSWPQATIRDRSLVSHPAASIHVCCVDTHQPSQL